MFDNKILNWVAWALVIIGGINWGLVGLFNGNIISAIFGIMLSRIIFILVGLSAIYLIVVFFKTGSLSLSRDDMGGSSQTKKAEAPKETTQEAPSAKDRNDATTNNDDQNKENQ